MDMQSASHFYMAIPAIEARELQNAVRVASYPHLKDDSNRAKFDKKLSKIQEIVEKEEKAVSISQLANILAKRDLENV